MRTQIRHVTCLLLGLLGFKALPAQAVDMFLCIDGVQGEVTDAVSKRHAECIDVLAWSWGMSSSSSNTGGVTGGGAGKVNMQDISVTKWLDRASPVLGAKIAEGKTLGNMVLYVEVSCGTGCGTPHYRLEIPPGSFVTSQSQGGSGGEERLTENVTFNFPAIEWCYSYDADGAGGSGAPVDVCDGWNVVTGMPYP